MSNISLLLISTVVLGLVIFVLIVAAAIHKLWWRLTVYKDAERQSAGRRAIVRILAGQSTIEKELAAMDPKQLRVFERLVLDHFRGFRRPEHGQLGAILTYRNSRERALRDSRKLGAIRRANAAKTLGAVGGTPQIDRLMYLLADRQLEVRTMAASSLGKLRVASAVPILLDCFEGHLWISASTIVTALVEIGDPGIPDLIDGLKTNSATARSVSAEVLGRLGAHDAIPALIATLMRDPDHSVRVHAASAMGYIGSIRAVMALQLVIDSDSSNKMKAAAIEAIGRTGDTDVVPLLATLLSDDDYWIAHNAAGALRRMGADGRRVLLEAANSHEQGADHAAEALAKVPYDDDSSDSEIDLDV